MTRSTQFFLLAGAAFLFHQALTVVCLLACGVSFFVATWPKATAALRYRADDLAWATFIYVFGATREATADRIQLTYCIGKRAAWSLLAAIVAGAVSTRFDVPTTTIIFMGAALAGTVVVMCCAWYERAATWAMAKADVAGAAL